MIAVICSGSVGFIDWLDALIPIRIIMCHVASVINGSHNDAARISEKACANGACAPSRIARACKICERCDSPDLRRATPNKTNVSCCTPLFIL